jgi:hypothetical protein
MLQNKPWHVVFTGSKVIWKNGNHHNKGVKQSMKQHWIFRCLLLYYFIDNFFCLFKFIILIFHPLIEWIIC